VLLLDAAAVIQSILDQAGLSDLAEAMMKMRRAERRAVTTYSPGTTRPRWTKDEGIAAGLVVDALIAMAAREREAEREQRGRLSE
jgi:hypothetical protein